MWFDVMQSAAAGADQGVKRAYLIQHVGSHLLRCELHFAATEVVAIGIAGVGADGNAAFQRRIDSGLHQARIAGMPSTGDVGRADEGHQFGVVGRAFAEIGVQVDMHSPVLS